MKKLLLISTALVAVAAAGSANAADLPVKAPMVAPPSDCHCEWTGWYLGGNAGGSIGVDDNASAMSGFPLAAPFTNPFLSSTDKRAMPGGLFGVQGGFNWHLNPVVVVGVEADWQWTNESTTMSVTGADQFPAVATFSYTAQEKIKSLATARARLGWAHNDYLWYVTGGAAWASIDSNFTLTSSFPPTTFASPFNASFNTSRTGWTIGGGVETCFLNYGPHNYWSAKLEYLFVDLGTINTLLTTPTTPAGTFATFAASDRFRDHIMRVGLNYHF
jgi:outer membrane immunogenic protein